MSNNNDDVKKYIDLLDDQFKNWDSNGNLNKSEIKKEVKEIIATGISVDQRIKELEEIAKKLYEYAKSKNYNHNHHTNRKNLEKYIVESGIDFEYGLTTHEIKSIIFPMTITLLVNETCEKINEVEEFDDDEDDDYEFEEEVEYNQSNKITNYLDNKRRLIERKYNRYGSSRYNSLYEMRKIKVITIILLIFGLGFGVYFFYDDIFIISEEILPEEPDYFKFTGYEYESGDKIDEDDVQILLYKFNKEISMDYDNIIYSDLEIDDIIEFDDQFYPEDGYFYHSVFNSSLYYDYYLVPQFGENEVYLSYIPYRFDCKIYNSYYLYDLSDNITNNDNDNWKLEIGAFNNNDERIEITFQDTLNYDLILRFDFNITNIKFSYIQVNGISNEYIISNNSLFVYIERFSTGIVYDVDISGIGTEYKILNYEIYQEKSE